MAVEELQARAAGCGLEDVDHSRDGVLRSQRRVRDRQLGLVVVVIDEQLDMAVGAFTGLEARG